MAAATDGVNARHRPARLRSAGALSLLAAMCACAGPAARHDQAELAWTLSPDPPAVGPATLVLTLRDGASRPIRGARLRVEGDMTHPGMRPAPADVAEIGDGRYAARLSFSMAGDWMLFVSAEWSAQGRLERRIPVRVRPPG